MDFFSFIDSKDVVLIGEAKQSFGRKLKQLRKSQQMTMDQMTSDFPITKPTIVKLEKGEGHLNSLFVYLKAINKLEPFLDDFFKDICVRRDILNKK